MDHQINVTLNKSLKFKAKESHALKYFFPHNFLLHVKVCIVQVSSCTVHVSASTVHVSACTVEVSASTA